MNPEVTTELSLQGAQQALAELIVPMARTETIALTGAFRRVLAGDLRSPIDVPSHDNSAMDGYALRHADLRAEGSTELPVVGVALAGKPFAGTVPAGAALRIMTGAVLPAELDTVVAQERCALAGQRVTVTAGQALGQHARRAGEDIARGAIALPAGRWLQAAEIGLIASLGLAEVTVRCQPRVAVFSTGDELLPAGAAVQPGKIYDSNRFTLMNLIRELGIEPIDLGIVSDRPDTLSAVLAQASQFDVLISSGGVSVGEADFTRTLMNQLGRIVFSTIAIRPGRPLAFGQIGPALYFGLPGNPVAVMVTYLFVVRDALYRLLGASAPALLQLQAESATAIRKRPGRSEFQRGIAHQLSDGRISVRLTGQQGSGVLSSMTQANCMLLLGPQQGDIAAGDWVTIVPFRGLL
jgi:molybdopterin molybdotransferase